MRLGKISVYTGNRAWTCACNRCHGDAAPPFQDHHCGFDVRQPTKQLFAYLEAQMAAPLSEPQAASCSGSRAAAAAGHENARVRTQPPVDTQGHAHTHTHTRTHTHIQAHTVSYTHTCARAHTEKTVVRRAATQQAVDYSCHSITAIGRCVRLPILTCRRVHPCCASGALPPVYPHV